MEGTEHLVLHSEDLYDFIDEIYYDLNYTSHPSNGSYDSNHALFCKTLVIPLPMHIFICIFYMLIFLLAIPGNLVVGLVVGSSRHALSSSELFLLHLALADLMLALTLPLSAVSVLQGWLFGNAVCKLVSMTVEVNFYTSILFLVCISADRYMVVVHAAKEGRARPRVRWIQSCITCACVWMLGLLLSLPAAIYHEAYVIENEYNQTQCGERYDTSSSNEWRIGTRMLRHFLGFLLPLCAMGGFYSVTVARLVQTRSFRKQRAMRVIVGVVAAFLFCWCPYHVTVMVDTLVRAKVLDSCQMRQQTDLALLVTQSLGLLHCCINPVLYAFVGERFRSNLKRMLQRTGVLERESMSRFSRSTSLTSQDGNTALM